MTEDRPDNEPHAPHNPFAVAGPVTGDNELSHHAWLTSIAAGLFAGGVISAIGLAVISMALNFLSVGPAEDPEFYSSVDFILAMICVGFVLVFSWLTGSSLKNRLQSQARREHEFKQRREELSEMAAEAKRQYLESQSESEARRKEPTD